MKKHLIAVAILLLYFIILIKILVFKDMPLVRIGTLMLNFGGTHEGPANLTPFKTIIPYLLGKNGLIIASINIVGNIILFVPIGFLFPLTIVHSSWKKIIATSIATGFIIEGMQAFLHLGIFDIDDVILNGLGVMIGYWCFTLFSRFSPLIKKILNITSTTIILLIASIYIIAYYKNITLPISFEAGAHHTTLDNFKSLQNGSAKCCDLCNGTGGTGVIVAMDSLSITIKGKKGNGENQQIKLTEKTVIRNSAGIITKSILKIGDHVTVIINESETASLVLVCGILYK